LSYFISVLSRSFRKGIIPFSGGFFHIYTSHPCRKASGRNNLKFEEKKSEVKFPVRGGLTRNALLPGLLRRKWLAMTWKEETYTGMEYRYYNSSLPVIAKVKPEAIRKLLLQQNHKKQEL
jgi:hypothetical protein